MGRREDVEQSSAHAEIAAVFDQRHAPEAPVVQLLGQVVEVEIFAFHQVTHAPGELLARRHAQQQRFRGGDDERVLRLLQMEQPLDAGGDALRRRRKILERRRIPGWKVVNATLKRRRGFRLPEEETQVFDESLGDFCRRRHDQGRAG